MDKAELNACLEQADSKEAGTLLRSARRNKIRRSSDGGLQRESARALRPEPFSQTEIRILQSRKLACESEARRASALQPSAPTKTNSPIEIQSISILSFQKGSCFVPPPFALALEYGVVAQLDRVSDF